MEQQLGVSQYYDVPVITIRSLILPIIFNDYRDAERFFTRKSEVSDDASWEEKVDLRHVSPVPLRGANYTRIFPPHSSTETAIVPFPT